MTERTAVLAHAVADRLLTEAEDMLEQEGAKLITALSDESERRVLDWLGIAEAHELDPERVERLLEDDDRKAHGDPSLAGDGLLVPVDADCPHCGWPERTFDTGSRRFGCIRCTYASDERNA